MTAAQRVKPKDTTCGVIVTDGHFLLLGHATRPPRWDIPKGVAEPGEEFEQAARRELQEETGLIAPDELIPLGVFPYRRDKDLALFGWPTETLPNPRDLVCVACFALAGKMFPEFDRFGLFTGHRGGSFVRIYFDDLKYTAARQGP